MELLWIIFITVLAVGFAYFVGDKIDRRASARAAEREAESRRQWLREVAAFSRGFAELLAGRTLIARHTLPAAGKALGRYILEHCDEPVDEAEWALLCEAIETPGETAGD